MSEGQTDLGQQNTQGFIMNNAAFNNANALQIRLDMRDEVRNFQKYILGIEVMYEEDPETGETNEKIIKSGQELVNDKGFQCLMGWISFVVNKHTMMGNFIDEDWYANYLCDLHKDVWFDLLINREDYGINLRQLQPVHARFMMCSRLILTRPIFDKERLGMNSTTRIEERSATIPNKGGGFFGGFPFMGGKK